MNRKNVFRVQYDDVTITILCVLINTFVLFTNLKQMIQKKQDQESICKFLI